MIFQGSWNPCPLLFKVKCQQATVHKVVPSRSSKEPRPVPVDEHLNQDFPSGLPLPSYKTNPLGHMIFKVPSCWDLLCHSDLCGYPRSLATSSLCTYRSPSSRIRTRSTDAWKNKHGWEPRGWHSANRNGIKLITLITPPCSLSHPPSLLPLPSQDDKPQWEKSWARLFCGISTGSAYDSI